MFPTKSPELLHLGNFCVPQTPLAWQRVLQDVGRTSPASRKTTGHCPQFPPNLGIVPGSSNGLGVAPGHWGLPLGSRSPSAASTARRRALAPASAPSAPADAASSLAVSSPPPPCPGWASGPHRPRSRLGWPALASGGRRRDRRGTREPAAGLPLGGRTRWRQAPRNRHRFSLIFVKILIVGIAPRRPRSGAGKALGRRDAEERRTALARRLQPAGPGLGRRARSAERGRGD